MPDTLLACGHCPWCICCGGGGGRTGGSCTLGLPSSPCAATISDHARHAGVEAVGMLVLQRDWQDAVFPSTAAAAQPQPMPDTLAARPLACWKCCCCGTGGMPFGTACIVMAREGATFSAILLAVRRMRAASIAAAKAST